MATHIIQNHVALVKFDHWIFFFTGYTKYTYGHFIKNYLRGYFFNLIMWPKYFRWSVMTMWDLILTKIPFNIIYVTEQAVGKWTILLAQTLWFQLKVHGSKNNEWCKKLVELSWAEKILLFCNFTNDIVQK